MLAVLDRKDDYSGYNDLLLDSEMSLPYGVKKTILFFETRKIWFQLSRNHEARSCRDAAHKRTRLGHTGISLSDELKSFFGRMSVGNGEHQYIAIHCRANDQLDMQKVRAKLQTENNVERLSTEDLANIFNLDYGLVNPFTLDPDFLALPVLQVFDEHILDRGMPPFTMTTNAGDLTYTVEFRPDELVSATPHKMVGDIVLNKPHHLLRHQTIGILTGNGPESGLFLWNEINETIRRRLGTDFSGDISFPPVIVQSLPAMGLSMELDIREKDTWDAIKSGITSLCKDGATICCIACNTAQYFTPQIKEICAQYDATFISIPEALELYLVLQNIHEFDLLGIKYVADFEKWSAFRVLKDKFNITLPEKAELEKINELAFKVKKDGITGPGINKLRDLLSSTAKTNNVVIALTEISILMSAQKKNRSGKNFIDTLMILANVIAEEYLKHTYLPDSEDLDDE